VTDLPTISSGHDDVKTGLFRAVLIVVMFDVHARLARDADAAPTPLDGVQRGIHSFLTVCSEPATRQVVLIDGPAVLGWHEWRPWTCRTGSGCSDRDCNRPKTRGRFTYQTLTP
jgi:hypothetical protein